ncbi:hypothetical protein I6N95_03780 [Vagococcus sp. BWB3-3]|uniref:Uncharacterized protein n=1 Tax=Vagococcus allomyrinae TaxID=2794353 RepID=A0A940STB3_9ENTE|nr:hypothetical protein [Vagococcus allomyrinae]MBP1040125.1 hypothetical protein [Vagococcus allomyrinae]
MRNEKNQSTTLDIAEQLENLRCEAREAIEKETDATLKRVKRLLSQDAPSSPYKEAK